MLGAVERRADEPPIAAEDSRIDTVGNLGGAALPRPPLGPGRTGAGRAPAGRRRSRGGRRHRADQGEHHLLVGQAGAQAKDFVAAEKLGESQIELARATGDLSAYVAAEASLDTALRLSPDMPAALAYKGVVLVALHRFVEARALADGDSRRPPDDPTSLATLGDANLELGDIGGARGRLTNGSAASRLGAAASVRLGHLAFIVGDTAGAIGHATSRRDRRRRRGDRSASEPRSTATSSPTP